jgi:hypothetical protein
MSFPVPGNERTPSQVYGYRKKGLSLTILFEVAYNGKKQLEERP